jgi:hypothetical protein
VSFEVRGRQVRLRSIVIWTAVGLLGAVAWGILALARGESISAVWLLFAAVCSYAIAYRSSPTPPSTVCSPRSSRC